MASIREVAKLAGVSPSTDSCFLMPSKNAQKLFGKDSKFMHTLVDPAVILTLVNPNSLYSFCYTP